MEAVEGGGPEAVPSGLRRLASRLYIVTTVCAKGTALRNVTNVARHEQRSVRQMASTVSRRTNRTGSDGSVPGGSRSKADPSYNRQRAEAPHGHTCPLSPSGESVSVPPLQRRDRDERGASCRGVSTMLARPAAGVLPASLTVVRRVIVLPTADPLEWDAWETWELLGDHVPDLGPCPRIILSVRAVANGRPGHHGVQWLVDGPKASGTLSRNCL